MSVPSSSSLQRVFDRAKRDFEDALPAKARMREILAINSAEKAWDAIERLQEEQSRQGKLRILNRIKPFLDALQSYAAVIEVFVQVKPDVMALIWGPIKLILQLIDNWHGVYDAVTRTMGSFGDLLPRFQRVVQPFVEKDWIQDALGLFYRYILDFHHQLLQLLSRPRKLLPCPRCLAIKRLGMLT
jgi:hypothetical protein